MTSRILSVERTILLGVNTGALSGHQQIAKISSLMRDVSNPNFVQKRSLKFNVSNFKPKLVFREQKKNFLVSFTPKKLCLLKSVHKTEK